MDFAVLKMDAKAKEDCIIATYKFKHKILHVDRQPNKMQVMSPT